MDVSLTAYIQTVPPYSGPGRIRVPWQTAGTTVS